MKGENIGIVLAVPAVIACLVLLAIAKMIVEPSVKANATATVLEASRTRTPEDHALDTAEEVAKVGFAANVAIAASGDASQTAIVRSFSNVFIAIVLAVAGVVAAYFMINKKTEKREEEQQQ
jgi:hypothetical protein